MRYRAKRNQLSIKGRTAYLLVACFKYARYCARIEPFPSQQKIVTMYGIQHLGTVLHFLFSFKKRNVHKPLVCNQQLYLCCI